MMKMNVTPDRDGCGPSRSPDEPNRLQAWLDGVAVVLAGTCGVHCILTPLALVVLPFLAGTIFLDDRFHVWMLATAFPVTLFAIFRGCRRHRDMWVWLLAGTGLVVLSAGIFAGHTVAGENGERALTVLGGAALAAGHIRNYRLSS